MRKYFIVVNPAAGSRRSSTRVKRILKRVRSRFDFELFETKPEFHADRLIRDFFDPAIFTDILVVGGDGTINESLNGIDGKTVTVSFISTGTGNDIARSHVGKLRLDKQIGSALNGSIYKVDTGKCNGRVFMNGVGIGFDGKVVEDMMIKGKRFNNSLAYLHTVTRLLSGYVESELNIIIDGNRIQRTVFLMTIAKGKYFGGGFLVNPFAKPDDGQLDICIINKIPVKKRFLYLPTMKSGGHKSLKEVEFYKCRECIIEPNDQMVAHIDGEFAGSPPFHIKVCPGSLDVRKY
ncbi:MAG TPA: diacylglycerol kinase family protein [Cyclobacteriaceae bacterium]|nr:diacylglycerol kinase family protein [Cyclobacteriaceae bacterium]